MQQVEICAVKVFLAGFWTSFSLLCYGLGSCTIHPTEFTDLIPENPLPYVRHGMMSLVDTDAATVRQ